MRYMGKLPGKYLYKKRYKNLKHAARFNCHNNATYNNIKYCIQDGTCDSNPTNMMGDPASSQLLGDFYLKTNSEYPYAMPSQE